ncbi:hypothetical protein MHYP_G00021170 [Metynnis hypsauchen]
MKPFNSAESFKAPRSVSEVQLRALTAITRLISVLQWQRGSEEGARVPVSAPAVRTRDEEEKRLTSPSLSSLHLHHFITAPNAGPGLLLPNESERVR